MRKITYKKLEDSGNTLEEMKKLGGFVTVLTVHEPKERKSSIEQKLK